MAPPVTTASKKDGIIWVTMVNGVLVKAIKDSVIIMVKITAISGNRTPETRLNKSAKTIIIITTIFVTKLFVSAIILCFKVPAMTADPVK